MSAEQTAQVVCRCWPTDRPGYWGWDIEAIGVSGNAYSGRHARRRIGERLTSAVEHGHIAPHHWPVIRTLPADPRKEGRP